MSNQLPKETIKKIKAEAERYADQFKHGAGYREPAYADGATEWGGKAQELADTLEQIQNAPVPYNTAEMESWIETARNLAAAALAKYKEVNNG